MILSSTIKLLALGLLLASFWQCSESQPAPVKEHSYSTLFAMAKKVWLKEHSNNPKISPIMAIVDFSKPSNQNRFYVVNFNTGNVLFVGTVSHGKNSGDLYSHSFSNVPESNKSSIGVFKTGATYTGKHGLSLKLFGLEPGINDNAFERDIVVHSAAYATPMFTKAHGRLGESKGCFVLDPKYSSHVINMLKDGSILFAYYPDSQYIKSSKYLK